METYLDLRGVVNGQPVEAAGTGKVGDKAKLAVQAARVPLGWDPVLAVPAWADGIALARGRSPDDPPLLARSRQVLLDEGGRELGRAVVALVGRYDGDVLGFRAQLVEADYRLEPLEEVVAVGGPEVGTVAGVMTSVWRLRTSRGHEYALVSTTVGEVARAMAERPVVRERLEGATRVEVGWPSVRNEGDL